MLLLSKFAPPVTGVVLAALLAACGSSSTPTAAAGATAAAGGGATTAPVATPAAPAVTPAGGGASGVAACSLNTTDEVAAVVGGPVTAKATSAGANSYCTYLKADGTFAISVTYNPNEPAVYDAEKSAGQAVSGLGDGAVYVDGYGLLVLKGQAIYLVNFGGGAIDAATAITEGTTLANAALARF